jgi:hypothetical protein
MTVKWTKTNDNEFNPAGPHPGTIGGSEWQCGIKVNMVAESQGGCNDIADIVFRSSRKKSLNC